MGLGDEKGGYARNLYDHPTVVIRFKCGDLEIVVVQERSLDSACLAGGGPPMRAWQQGTTAACLRGDLRRHDEVHGNSHVTVAPGTSDPLLPHSGLACVLETGRLHGVSERRLTRQVVGMDDQIGVGCVGRKSGQPVNRT